MPYSGQVPIAGAEKRRTGAILRSARRMMSCAKSASVPFFYVLYVLPACRTREQNRTKRTVDLNSDIVREPVDRRGNRRDRSLRPVWLFAVGDSAEEGGRRSRRHVEPNRHPPTSLSTRRRCSTTFSLPVSVSIRTQKVFERKRRYFVDNSVGWHLETNSFHQHVRLLMKISPHTFF